MRGETSMEARCTQGCCYHTVDDPDCLAHDWARKKIQRCCRCGHVLTHREINRLGYGLASPLTPHRARVIAP